MEDVNITVEKNSNGQSEYLIEMKDGSGSVRIKSEEKSGATIALSDRKIVI